MLKIYYSDIKIADSEIQYNNFSQYRLKRLAAMKPELNKKQGIAAELMLIAAIKNNVPSCRLPLDIKTNDYGKPYCTDLPFKFSISHSGNFAACAISDFELGLDIQKLSPYSSGLAARHFSFDEQEYIEKSADKDRAFTKIWSMKESYIKYAGSGLNTPLNSFSVCGKSRIPGVNFITELIGDCSLSICLSSNEEKTEIFNII